MSKQLSYQKLNELFNETSEALTETLKENRSMQEEIKYLHIPPERSSQSALAVRLSGPNGET